MDHYIVRLYREGKDDPRKLVGIVENVAVEGGWDKRAFTNMEELWTILNSAGRPGHPAKKREEGRYLSGKQ